CGNGGPASVAHHLQCDHVKSERQGTSLRNRGLSLSAKVDLLSAIAHDLSYHDVLEYQLQSQPRSSDVLCALSSSGAFARSVRAVAGGHVSGLHTIALTGFEREPTRPHPTGAVHVASSTAGVVEKANHACMHMLAQYVRYA